MGEGSLLWVQLTIFCFSDCLFAFLRETIKKYSQSKFRHLILKINIYYANYWKYLSRNLIYFSHSENVPNSRETFQEIISFYIHSVIIFLSDWHCRISQKHYSTEMVAVGVCVQFQGRRKKTTTAYPLLTTNLYQALWNQISFLCE